MCKKITIDSERVSPIPRELLKDVLKKQTTETEAMVDPISPDVLAQVTIYTKEAVEGVKNLYQAFKSSKCYRIITGTTQPAHLVVMLCILFVAAALYPVRDRTQHSSVSVYYQFMYVTATAAHFGSQIWMTFISGLSLYFTLPRHDFGEVQKILFPIYFAFTGLLSAACIVSHAQLFGVSGTTFLLVVCFMVEILVRVRLCDPLVSLIISKNEVEAKHGLGREVGKLARDSELFSSPSYTILHHKFRRLHMTIAIANMTCIGLSTLHIWLSLQDNQVC